MSTRGRPKKKFCKRCGASRDMTKRRVLCTSCYADFTREELQALKKYARENPGKMREANELLIQRTHHRWWARGTINNHRKKGIRVDLTIDQLELIALNTPDCPICAKSLAWGVRLGRKHNMSPSLDRINNENFITIDNSWIICDRCNSVKGTRTLSEFIAFCHEVGQFTEADFLARASGAGLFPSLGNSHSD